MLKKTTVSLLVIGAFLVAGAGIANAAADPYVEQSNVSVDPATIGQSQRSIVSFSEGYFEPGETVAITVSGESGSSASVALIAPAARSVGTTSKVAGADGSLVATFTAPAKGSGAYNVAFAGTRNYTAVITVTAADGGSPAAAADPGLAATGGTVSAIVLWTGIGAILAGIIALAVGIARRRRA